MNSAPIATSPNSDLTRRNLHVKVQEDFKDYGNGTLDGLDLLIADCDAVLHLVGDMTGAERTPTMSKARAFCASTPIWQPDLRRLRRRSQRANG